MKFKIGDMVKVVKKIPEWGKWRWSSPNMDDSIGKTFTIATITDGFTYQLNNGYKYPEECLEFISTDPEVGKMKLRIISDGTPQGTKVIDGDTGKVLPYVQSIEWRISACDLAEVIITLKKVPADFVIGKDKTQLRHIEL